MCTTTTANTVDYIAKCQPCNVIKMQFDSQNHDYFLLKSPIPFAGVCSRLQSRHISYSPGKCGKGKGCWSFAMLDHVGSQDCIYFVSVCRTSPLCLPQYITVTWRMKVAECSVAELTVTESKIGWGFKSLIHKSWSHFRCFFVNVICQPLKIPLAVIIAFQHLRGRSLEISVHSTSPQAARNWFFFYDYLDFHEGALTGQSSQMNKFNQDF